MKIQKATVASLLLAATILPAFATPTVITFDDKATVNPIAANLVAYPDSVTLSSGAWLIASSQAIGFENSKYGNFYGKVGDSTYLDNVGALLLSANPASAPVGSPQQSSFRISVANGFNGQFSIDFAGNGAAHLQAYDSSGKEFALGATSSGSTNPNGCASPYSCNWSTLSFDLGSALDVAYVDVYGTEGRQWFDNITFASINADPTTPGTVPEPGGVALSLAALGALAWTRKRRISGKRSV